MKPLKLSSTQKKNLLEMAQKLCKPYDHFAFVDHNCLYIFEEESGKDLTIHWFEFCFRILAKKLLTSENGKYDYDDYIHFSDQLTYGKIHPIEYLYKIFKELNK